MNSALQVDPRTLTDEGLTREMERMRRALAAIRHGRQSPGWRRRAAEIEDALLAMQAVADERYI